MQTRNKIIARANISGKSQELKQENQKIVFTNGCFDILHPGHVTLLEKASEYGDRLIIGINTDESVKRLKGEGRPINDQSHRARVLAGLEAVDYITFFEEDTPAELIEEIIPDVLVKGGDYTPDEIVGRKTVQAKGGKVIVIPLVEGKSTTNIIDKIKNDR